MSCINTKYKSFFSNFRQTIIRDSLVDDSGRSWQIDNECSFVYGNLIHPNKYENLDTMLKTVCIFRRQTVAKVTELYRAKDKAAHVLWEVVNREAGLQIDDMNPSERIGCDILGERTIYSEWAELFVKRIADVYAWMNRCNDDDYDSLVRYTYCAAAARPLFYSP